MTRMDTAGGQGHAAAAGWVIVVASSCVAAVLVIAGLIYAMGTGARHEAALVAAGCEPALSPSGLPCTTQQMLIGEYMTILTPASRQMNADMAAYTASEGHGLLGAAEAALMAEATAENAFAANLAGIEFPPAIAPIAKALVRADQDLAGLTAEQARSSTLIQLGFFSQRVQVAGAAVQSDMGLLLRALRSPPHDGTE